jgi:hypothetical protein
MAKRRRRVRGRIVMPPPFGKAGTPDAARAWIGPDGSVTLPNGNVFRVGPAHRKPAARVVPVGDPPAVGWRGSHGRMALASTVFASAKGVFLKLEAENPFREARSLALEATVHGRGPFTGLKIVGSGLVSSEGGAAHRLLDVAGASASLGRRRAGKDCATVEIELVLPPRGGRALELALGPAGDVRASSLERAYAGTAAAWDDLKRSLASCNVPDGTLAAAFERAWYVVFGSVSAGAAKGAPRPWLRPGLAPISGPATLDSLALGALDEWGAARLVEDSLRPVIETQGSAAPPGDSFTSARGFLSLPPEEDARARWGSDCGALLWAICSRGAAGARKGWLRSVRRGVEDACSWIRSELRGSGLLPASRGPKMLARAARAWNDAWTWRGLDAAAGMLEGIGAASAADVRRAAERYRAAVARAYGGSSEGRACLDRLEVAGRKKVDDRLHAARLRSLHEWAGETACAGLTAEGEFRTAVFFLRTLRRLLVEEEAGGKGELRIFPGAPASWFDEGSRLEIERMPTSAGPVTVRAMAAPGGGRLIVDAELPSGAPEAVLRLGRRLGETRVNGQRWRRTRSSRSPARSQTLGQRGRPDDAAAGLVRLPKGGGIFEMSAELARRSRR